MCPTIYDKKKLMCPILLKLIPINEHHSPFEEIQILESWYMIAVVQSACEIFSLVSLYMSPTLLVFLTRKGSKYLWGWGCNAMQ